MATTFTDDKVPPMRCTNWLCVLATWLTLIAPTAWAGGGAAAPASPHHEKIAVQPIAAPAWESASGIFHFSCGFASDFSAHKTRNASGFCARGLRIRIGSKDPSGLDWEWITGDDSTYLRGTNLKLWNNANGYWSFVPGSDPAVPRPVVSLSDLEADSPKVPIGASGNPTIDLNYFTANASVIDPRFDADYDRTPYLRDNAVYNAVVDGLGLQMGVAGLPAAAQADALAKIDAIAIRASWVRGRAQTSTMSYLDPSFWAQGGGALNQLEAQTVNAATLYALTTLTGAAGDLALMEAGGQAFTGLIAARNLARLQTAQHAAGGALRTNAIVAERQLARLVET